jgi:SAM-dependent MidA family methyltransferase
MDYNPVPLEAEIRRLIKVAGPMPVAKYMAMCLSHPEYGYYVNRDPFGAAGDFTTAPEISQMFGELIGLWAVAVWRMLGAPSPVYIVELGPGRGTLMADALRAARVVPAFDEAITVHLVESSPALRRMQRRRLEEYKKEVTWYGSLAEVPSGPTLLFANEFFDAVPVNQAVKRDGKWYERTVEVGPGDRLRFGIAREPISFFDQTIPQAVRNAPNGAIFEWRSHQMAFEVGRRVVRGGAALIIDYGHRHSDIGETLQAVRAHRYDNPLSAPGLADLSAHVDFEALGFAAARMGARVHGPVEQGTLLRSLGLEQRARGLKARASAEQAQAIDAAISRLTDVDERGMGRMFKAIGFSDPRLIVLPGFETRLSQP